MTAAVGSRVGIGGTVTRPAPTWLREAVRVVAVPVRRVLPRERPEDEVPLVTPPVPVDPWVPLGELPVLGELGELGWLGELGALDVLGALGGAVQLGELDGEVAQLGEVGPVAGALLTPFES